MLRYNFLYPSLLYLSRIDDYEANPDNVMTWAEVKASIKARV
jgi:hypothetical protein